MRFAFQTRFQLGILLVLLGFSLSGCSHLTTVLVVNYTNEEIEWEGIKVSPHNHKLDRAYLGGGGGFPLKVTAGKKVIVDRNVDAAERDRNMIGDNLMLLEVK